MVLTATFQDRRAISKFESCLFLSLWCGKAEEEEEEEVETSEEKN